MWIVADTRVCLVDVYTYLGLGSGNEYNIKASLYSSTEVLKAGNMTNGKIGNFFRRKIRMRGSLRSLAWRKCGFLSSIPICFLCCLLLLKGGSRFEF